MARIGQVIPKHVVARLRQVSKEYDSAIRLGSQRMILLRQLFERSTMTTEEAIEAQSIIKLMIGTDYYKRRQSVRLEIQQWQRRLDELLPSN